MKRIPKKFLLVGLLFAFFIPIFFSTNTHADKVGQIITDSSTGHKYTIDTVIGNITAGESYAGDKYGKVYKGFKCYLYTRDFKGVKPVYTVRLTEVKCQNNTTDTKPGGGSSGSNSGDSGGGSDDNSGGSGGSSGGSGGTTTPSATVPSTDNTEDTKVVTDAGGSTIDDWGGSIVTPNTDANAKLAEICAKYEPGTPQYISSGCTELSKTQDDRSCRYLLGLASWDCNVGVINSEETLKSNIWVIVANVLTDISIIATYLVIGYVIYGGYQYIFAGGDPGKVEKGKKTLNQAFIGLAITMSATVILNAIRIALGANFAANCASGGTGCITIDTADNMVIGVINWVTGISGLIAAIFVVYGGILYFTSAGEPSKLEKAKKTLTYSLIGLAIVALATTITAFMSGIIREANKNAYIQQNQTIISKEVTHVKNY